MEKGINQRKTEHIRLCLEGEVEGVNKSTGWKEFIFSIMLCRRLTLLIFHLQRHS